MKKILLASLISAVWLTGCSEKEKNKLVSPVVLALQEDVSALHKQFHGKYKVISSVSNEAVDIDLDGVSSRNMLLELTELNAAARTKYGVEIRIYGPSAHNPKPRYIFTQWWPEQYIRTGPGTVWNGGDPLEYNPDYLVKYDFQGAIRGFTFATDLKRLFITPDKEENRFRWVRPESVTVDEAGRIIVAIRKHLYTRAGVKEVTITTTYERYTTAT